MSQPVASITATVQSGPILGWVISTTKKWTFFETNCRWRCWWNWME